jgi:transglutaminase-like putative cysteine protease
VEKLTRWVASHVKAASSDSPSPLETLKKDKGNSLAHARLFASLARAAGIPTRPVSGLVYVREKGFLYHAWAECYIGYWLPVDPTLGEVPANATHVKLVEGDSPENLADLSEFIGKIKVKVIEQKHQ